MANRRVYSTESERSAGPLPPEAVRMLGRIWHLHAEGKLWTEVGREVGMGPAGVEIAFNKLLDRAYHAGQADEVDRICAAYEMHCGDCPDCDGPSPEASNRGRGDSDPARDNRGLWL